MPRHSRKTFRAGDDNSGAIFDATEKFRYHLWRVWDDERPRLCFVMLNPSTADHLKLDPTVSRCVTWAKKWKYGSLDVVNVFAYRSTDASKLTRVADPIGPGNDEAILRAASRSKKIVLAWGNHGQLGDRHEEVLEQLSHIDKLYCFGITKLGQPKHPLYVAGATELVTFPRRRP